MHDFVFLVIGNINLVKTKNIFSFYIVLKGSHFEAYNILYFKRNKNLRINNEQLTTKIKRYV